MTATRREQSWIRYARAVVGSVLIVALYGILAIAVLGVISLSDCTPTDAQIANGERCAKNTQWLFYSVAVIEIAILVLILAVFLRRILPRQA